MSGIDSAGISEQALASQWLDQPAGAKVADTIHEGENSAIMFDISLWEAALEADRRLNQRALNVARALADHFRAGNGKCQLSAERIAGAAGLVSLNTTRDALSMLRQAGWIESNRPADTTRRGLQYRPTLSTSVVTTVATGAPPVQLAQPCLPSSSENS
jgi:hypothetical protein